MNQSDNKKVSANFIDDYYRKWSPQYDNSISDEIRKYTHYKLETIELEKTDYLNYNPSNQKVKNYIDIYRKTGECPHPILTSTYSIIDGVNRIQSFVEMGNIYILSYVGVI